MAEMASFEFELDRTERLSQKALSLSGLSIRLLPTFIVGFVPIPFLFGDIFPVEGFKVASFCALFIPEASFS